MQCTYINYIITLYNNFHHDDDTLAIVHHDNVNILNEISKNIA